MIKRIVIYSMSVTLLAFLCIAPHAGCARDCRLPDPITMQIHGMVAPGFEPVREQFARNFRDRGEVGAACCVYLRGARVVDLWAGYRDIDKKEPWNEDTLVCVFSTTKGMSAAAMVLAHSRGYFELDEPVARYWPEFGQAGKQSITVRQLLSHQAGLSAIDQKITPARIADLDSWATVLARQSPQWVPGSRHGYHGLTLGFYQNELIRRTDPKHRSIGQFFDDEIARPLGAEFYIGLPESIPPARVAAVQPFTLVEMFFKPYRIPARMLFEMLWPNSLTRRSLMNVEMKGPGDIAHPRWTRVEFPSASGVGSARGLARVLGALAFADPKLNLRPETLAELRAPARVPTGGMHDRILRMDMAYSLGFIRQCPPFNLGPSAHAFGAFGAGGSTSFGDPEIGLGFAYVMNRMSVHMGDDPRAAALVDSVYACVRASANRTP